MTFKILLLMNCNKLKLIIKMSIFLSLYGCQNIYSGKTGCSKKNDIFAGDISYLQRRSKKMFSCSFLLIKI